MSGFIEYLGTVTITFRFLILPLDNISHQKLPGFRDNAGLHFLRSKSIIHSKYLSRFTATLK
jgi:hypothetical protein